VTFSVIRSTSYLGVASWRAIWLRLSPCLATKSSPVLNARPVVFPPRAGGARGWVLGPGGKPRFPSPRSGECLDKSPPGHGVRGLSSQMDGVMADPLNASSRGVWGSGGEGRHRWPSGHNQGRRALLCVMGTCKTDGGMEGVLTSIDMFHKYSVLPQCMDWLSVRPSLNWHVPAI
jgi:hypothetical protein